MKSSIFWDITPCSPLKVNRRFGGTELCLPPTFTLVSCSVYSSTLMMEAMCSSETSVDIQRTTRNYVPVDIAFVRQTLFLWGEKLHLSEQGLDTGARNFGELHNSEIWFGGFGSKGFNFDEF
jgi:hypothetical protein